MAVSRILVAEDDALVAADLREALEEMGHAVSAVVSSGDDAPEAARATGADLALLDVRMPGRWDGIEAGRRIRETLGIPVIYLSAYADDATMDRATETAPMGYVVKPFEPRQLRAAIHVALHRTNGDTDGRYRDLFRALAVPLFVSTASDGRIVDANDGFLAWMGLPRESVIGRTESEIDLWQDGWSRREALGRMRRWGGLRAFETSMRKPSGAVRRVELYLDPVNLDGEPCILVMFRDVSDRVAFERDLEQLALHDTVTGLPNRRLFHDRLQHAISRARRGATDLAVLFLDLDRFKEVNDTLGHEAGDRVLASVAERIRRCFREQDTVARLGGDEFGVLLSDVEGPEIVEELARRVLEDLATGVHLSGVKTPVGVSVGIVLGSGRETSADDLLRASDAAMYEAKQAGGGTFRIFDAARSATESGRSRLEAELRQAVALDQFVFEMLPIVEIESGRIVGAEALARWAHPERGLLPPSSFLPTAEATGLFAPLGRRLLNRACLLAARWDRLGLLPTSTPFRIGVNVSDRDFGRAEWIRELESLLRDAGASPRHLQIELPEVAVAGGGDRIRRLREIGFTVAVDDFGSSHSPFAYLRSVEVDAIKLDRSLVHGSGAGNGNRAIARAAFALARDLGISAIGTGIESREESLLLLDMGCRLGQGYHYGRPFSRLAFEERLRPGGPIVPEMAG